MRHTTTKKYHLTITMCFKHVEVFTGTTCISMHFKEVKNVARCVSHRCI